MGENDKWDYTIRKITIRAMASWSSLLLSPCHHDHYDDHDQNYEERVYYVEGEALSVFCAQLAGMGFSLAPNQYTQNIHKTLWGTVGNKQNRMLSHCHYHHYHHNHNNHSLWECEQEKTEIYGASLWDCGQAKHRDIYCGDGGLVTRNQPKNTECTEYIEYTKCTEYTEYTECTGYTECTW